MASTCGERRQYLQRTFKTLKQFGRAAARGRCWPAQTRPHRIFPGGTDQGTATADLSLADIPCLTPVHWDRVAWGLESLL